MFDYRPQFHWTNLPDNSAEEDQDQNELQQQQVWGKCIFESQIVMEVGKDQLQRVLQSVCLARECIVSNEIQKARSYYGYSKSLTLTLNNLTYRLNTQALHDEFPLIAKALRELKLIHYLGTPEQFSVLAFDCKQLINVCFHYGNSLKRLVQEINLQTLMGISVSVQKKYRFSKKHHADNLRIYHKKVLESAVSQTTRLKINDLLEWRDLTARIRDQSPQSVLPQLIVMELAKIDGRSISMLQLTTLYQKHELKRIKTDLQNILDIMNPEPQNFQSKRAEQSPSRVYKQIVSRQQLSPESFGQELQDTCSNIINSLQLNQLINIFNAQQEDQRAIYTRRYFQARAKRTPLGSKQDSNKSTLPLLPRTLQEVFVLARNQIKDTKHRRKRKEEDLLPQQLLLQTLNQLQI